MNIPVTMQLVLLFYVVNSVASALVQALPVPNGSVGYTFIYKFLSLLTADFKSFSSTMPMPVPTIQSSTGQIDTVSKPINTSNTANTGIL
jgi:hypothetical protein